MSVIFGTILYIYNPVYPKNMSKTLFEELASGHYILYYKGELVVTNKFLREFAEPPPADIPVIPVATPEPIETLPVAVAKVPESAFLLPVPAGLNIPILPDRLASPLKQFILDAEVPEKSKTREPYYLNRFNTKAEKVLINAMKSGQYQYDILLAATKLYYKSGGFPKTIANYFLEGIWSGCYEDMLSSLKNGTAAEHIAKGLDKSDEDGFSRYQR